MNPKHSISNSTLYNQTSQYNIHYTKWTLNTPYKTQHITTNFTIQYSLHKMNPKHSISKSAHYNQTSQYNIHYTNSQQFETVLNYRIKANGYVKWEKFVSYFRWPINQPIGKYIVFRIICLWAVSKYEQKYMEC